MQRILCINCMRMLCIWCMCISCHAQIAGSIAKRAIIAGGSSAIQTYSITNTGDATVTPFAAWGAPLTTNGSTVTWPDISGVGQPLTNIQASSASWPYASVNVTNNLSAISFNGAQFLSQVNLTNKITNCWYAVVMALTNTGGNQDLWAARTDTVTNQSATMGTAALTISQDANVAVEPVAVTNQYVFHFLQYGGAGTSKTTATTNNVSTGVAGTGGTNGCNGFVIGANQTMGSFFSKVSIIQFAIYTNMNNSASNTLTANVRSQTGLW